MKTQPTTPEPRALPRILRATLTATGIPPRFLTIVFMPVGSFYFAPAQAQNIGARTIVETFPVGVSHQWTSILASNYST